MNQRQPALLLTTLFTALLGLSACSQPRHDQSYDEDPVQLEQEGDTSAQTTIITPADNKAPIDNPSSESALIGDNSDLDSPPQDTTLVNDERTAPPISDSTTNQDETLNSEILLLVDALRSIDQDSIQQQAQIREKLQQASSRADDDAITNITLGMFKSQQAKLQAVPLTIDSLQDIREKMVAAIELRAQVGRDSLAIAKPTAEDEKRLTNQMLKSKQLSEEANKELWVLANEQGLINN